MSGNVRYLLIICCVSDEFLQSLMHSECVAFSDKVFRIVLYWTRRRSRWSLFIVMCCWNNECCQSCVELPHQRWSNRTAHLLTVLVAMFIWHWQPLYRPIQTEMTELINCVRFVTITK